MTIRRVNCDALDAGVCGGVAADVEPAVSSSRLAATRAKLADRRATLMCSSRRPLLRRRTSRLWRSCDNIDVEEDTNKRTAVRRHSNPLTDSDADRRGVTFSFPLVTDVETRPYTDPADKPLLFYSRADIACFKARRKCRERDISFADEVVTEVWEPTCALTSGAEAEAEMSRFYYTQEELHGFLQEFLATLEAGTQDDDDDDDCCCVPERPVDEAVGQSAAGFDELDFFDDVPLGDGDCIDDDGAVPEGIEDSDSESDDSSDSDSESDDEEAEAARHAVWPAPSPPVRAYAAVPPSSPNVAACAAETAEEATVDAVGADADDEWDTVDCGSSHMMGERLEQAPTLAAPILGC